MLSIRPWMRWVAVVVLPAILMANCVVAWDGIKPKELPKVSNMPEVPTNVSYKVGNVWSRRTVLVPTGRFERPDGRILERKGHINARIKSRGQVFYFNHPIVAKVEGEQLIVQSENRGRTVFNLRDIEAVELRRVTGWAVFWSITGGLLLGAILSVAIIFGVSASN